MMLLNRYLQAVGKCLPGARRDDIVEELRTNILAQLEDRERDLGHPLTEDEQIVVLRRYGNPAIIAGRYCDHNLGLAFGRQLIGPELFPFYKTVLFTNLLITAVILAGVMPTIAHFVGEAISPTRILMPLVTQFGILTFVFVIVERNKERLFENWDPRKLPSLKASPEDGVNARNIFNFIVLALGTLWLVLTPHWPFLLLGPGASYLYAVPLKLMPQWIDYYRAIVALLGAQLALQFLNLFRFLPRRQVRNINLALKGMGLCINILLLFRAPNYVCSQYPEVADWANVAASVCLTVSLMINIWQTGKLLLSVSRELHQTLPADQH